MGRLILAFASCEWRLLSSEPEVFNVLFVRMGRPTDRCLETLALRVGREALSIVEVGCFAEGVRTDAQLAIELDASMSHLGDQTGKRCWRRPGMRVPMAETSLTPGAPLRPSRLGHRG